MPSDQRPDLAALAICRRVAPEVPSRRSVLKRIARTGTALAAAQYFGPGSILGALAGPELQRPLMQPSEVRSEHGVLATTIAAAPGKVTLGELSFPGLLYNGSYIPPLLRARLGDTLRITFRNDLPDDPSNLHFHGMSVSPVGHGDNVFRHAHPGEQLDYEVPIPVADRQGPGFFWYHPHAHGVVAKQILGGMSGALVVDGSERLFPILKDLPERFLLLKHAELNDDNEIISINGQLDPTIAIRPGEMQFWRFGHIGATLFLKFRIEGMPLYVIATDGHPLSRPRKISELLVGPGERIDAIVIGPPVGRYAMTTVPFQNEAWRTPAPPQRLATIVSAGTTVAATSSEPMLLSQRVDAPRWIDEVRASPVAQRRTLNYSRTPDKHAFMINGRVMDESRVDETVSLGDTEEWTIVNTDQQYHSFHIHQTAFLVTEVNGVVQDEDSLRDTFSTPPATAAGPGILKVLIPFTDPVIRGKFVYHCHAVDHEDKGMMGIVEVVAREGAGAPPRLGGQFAPLTRAR
jgi:suppressor of ftsI